MNFLRLVLLRLAALKSLFKIIGADPTQSRRKSPLLHEVQLHTNMYANFVYQVMGIA